MPARRPMFWPAFLIGAGSMAAVDEILFHQVLAWHHFYDRGTPLLGLMSDGFLHAAELIALVTGFSLLLALRRQGLRFGASGWAGVLLGAGLFQLFDGLINHKVLRLHQIRYGVESLLPYDLAWNLSALLLILIGALLYRRAVTRSSEPASSDPP